MKKKWIFLIILLVAAAGLILYAHLTPNSRKQKRENAFKKVQDRIESMSATLPPDVVLPPSEGDEGKKTLLGIDSNKDGLRDDLERHLKTVYHGKPEAQRYLRSLYLATQEIIRTANDPDQSIKATNRQLMVIQCAGYLFQKNDPGLDDIYRQHKLMAMDTSARREAMLKSAKHYRGEVFLGLSNIEEEQKCKTIIK